MAWTNPTTETNGTVIGQTEWNIIVNDLLYLYAAVNAIAAKEGEGFHQIVSSTTETTIATWTVEADTLGAKGFLITGGDIIGYNSSGAARTITYKSKYGATTVFNTGALTVNNGVYNSMRAATTLGNRNNTSSQFANTVWDQAKQIALGTANSWEYERGFTQVAVENSTGDLAMAWTVELSFSDANLWTESWCWLEGPLTES